MRSFKKNLQKLKTFYALFLKNSIYLKNQHFSLLAFYDRPQKKGSNFCKMQRTFPPLQKASRDFGEEKNFGGKFLGVL
jgi:hypothetical protein